MEKNNSSHESSGFMNGFLLGCIVGAAIVALLVTKKGRKILKALTEEGMDGVFQLEELFTDRQKSDDGSQSRKSSNGKSHINIKDLKDEVVKEIKKDEEKIVKSIKATGRRFFRGTPKRN